MSPNKNYIKLAESAPHYLKYFIESFYTAMKQGIELDRVDIVDLENLAFADTIKNSINEIISDDTNKMSRAEKDLSMEKLSQPEPYIDFN